MVPATLISALKHIAITPGEPSGIGPDIVLKLVQQSLPAVPVAIADPELLAQRAGQLDIKVELKEYVHSTGQSKPHRAGELMVVPVSLATAVSPGKADTRNVQYVLDSISIAVQHCLDGNFHALVTGPVHKGIINDAGIAFSGHTEMLGELTNARPVMMLVSDSMRVALATTHLPLKNVSQALTEDHLIQTLQILHDDLKKRFHIAAPLITVAGLNPHAGENGHLGSEELEIITPAINKLRNDGLLINGPLPADTLFKPDIIEKSDAILAMYHDQGLPVIKYSSFGNAVNITLGLPIIRTSVDHGTALDLAGSGKADSGSLLAAFHLAQKMQSN